MAALLKRPDERQILELVSLGSVPALSCCNLVTSEIHVIQPRLGRSWDTIISMKQTDRNYPDEYSTDSVFHIWPVQPLQLELFFVNICLVWIWCQLGKREQQTKKVVKCSKITFLDGSTGRLDNWYHPMFITHVIFLSVFLICALFLNHFQRQA